MKWLSFFADVDELYRWRQQNRVVRVCLDEIGPDMKPWFSRLKLFGPSLVLLLVWDAPFYNLTLVLNSNPGFDLLIKSVYFYVHVVGLNCKNYLLVVCAVMICCIKGLMLNSLWTISIAIPIFHFDPFKGRVIYSNSKTYLYLDPILTCL